MSTFLDAILFGSARTILSRGVEIAQKVKLNFASPLKATTNGDQIDVEVENVATGPGPTTVAGEIPVFADAGGTVLAQSSAKIVDVAADTPAIMPRTANKAAFFIASDNAAGNGPGAYLIGGSGGGAGAYGGDSQIGGAAGIDAAHVGNVVAGYGSGARPTRSGMAGGIEQKACGAEPAGAAPVDHGKWYNAAGVAKFFGADNDSGTTPRPIMLGPVAAVADKAILTANGTPGRVAQGAATTLDAGDFTHATRISLNATSGATGSIGLTAGAGTDNVLALDAATGVSTLGGETSSGLAVNGADVLRATATAVAVAQPVTVTQAASVAAVTKANTATAATSTVQQPSPSDVLEGRVWDGAASRKVETRRVLVPLEAAISPTGVAMGVEKVETRMNEGSWIELSRSMAPDIMALSPLHAFIPGVGETAASNRVSNVVNQGSGGGNLVQATGGAQWLQTTWRGQPAWYLDGARYMVSDLAAAAWQHLSDGSGSTVVSLVHLFTENVAAYHHILDTGNVAGAANPGFGIWNNGTSGAGLILQARTMKTGPTVVKSHSGPTNQGPGTYLLIYRSKTGATTPNESTWYVNGVYGIAAYAAAAAAEAPAYTLTVGAGADAAHTYKTIGLYGPQFTWNRLLTDLEIATVVEPYFIGRWGWRPGAGTV